VLYELKTDEAHYRNSIKLVVCYGTGSGQVRDPEGARKKGGSGSEELRSRREAEGLGFNSCVAPSCTQVSYFGKPIRQKRKQGEPKSIFRLEIQEETSSAWKLGYITGK